MVPSRDPEKLDGEDDPGDHDDRQQDEESEHGGRTHRSGDDSESVSVGGRTITVLTREGCHLCDDLMPRVRRTAGALGYRVQVVDVDAAGLADRYGTRVPVVLDPGGEEIASGRIRTGPLVVALVRARR